MAEPGPEGAPPVPVAPRSWARRVATGFGRFWWEFLIGDTPELFVGAIVVIGAVALLCVDHTMRTAAAVLFPVLVAAVLGTSAWWASRRPPS